MKRTFLTGLGLVSLATGVVGMVVPVLPTTCFLLFAGYCFGKSSPRLHRWLHENRWFGAYLSDYRAGRGIPRRIKAASLLTLWLTIGATTVFVVEAWWLRALLVIIALVVTAHVAGQRTAAAPASASA